MPFAQCGLRKPIKVRLLNEAEEYFLEQPEKIQVKFHLAFDKVEAGHKGPWFEKLKELMVYMNLGSLTK